MCSHELTIVQSRRYSVSCFLLVNLIS